MPGSEPVDPHMVPTPAEVTQGLFRLARRMDFRQQAQDSSASLRASRRSVLIGLPGFTGVREEAITVHPTPAGVQ